MNVLHLSDLHRIIDPYYYPKRLKEQIKQGELIKDIVKINNIDVVAITGDIFEDWTKFYLKHRHIINDVTSPYIKLKDLIGGEIPIVFCLGNHEYARYRIEDTIEAYTNCKQVPNVYCLDVCNCVCINDVNFLGNVLWYDGNCSPHRTDGVQCCKHIDDSWLDCTIVDFDPIKENVKNVQKIKQSVDQNRTNVLLTHTVPYWKLNAFNYDQPGGIYNVYSGMRDLFNDHEVYVEYALCGHTHRRSVVEHLYLDGRMTECYNNGSDYNNLLFVF